MKSSKRILLFGSTGVIGSHFAKIIKKQGYKIVIADHPESQVKKLAKNINCNFIEIDAKKPNDLIDKIKDSYKFFNGFDCGIFNVAITSEHLKKNYKNPFPSFINYPLDMWQDAIDVNLTSCFLFSREMTKILKKNKNGGSIINTASIYGVIAPDKRIYKNENFDSFPAYSASKAGVIGLTKWLASYLADYKINVNSISPGGVQNKQSKTFINKYSKKTILGRMANSEDMSGILLFLIENRSKYITGQNFIIDGGFTAL